MMDMRSCRSHRVGRLLVAGGCLLGLFGGAVLQAGPSAAAAGDIASVTSVPPTDANFADIEVGPDGNLWTTNYLDRSITAISPSGAIIGTYPLPGMPTAVAAGADGLWVGYGDRADLSRVNVSGAVTMACNISSPASDLAIGPDGLYYPGLAGGNVGRTVLRRGSAFGCEESIVNTSGLSSTQIVAGPSGSGKLYVRYWGDKYGTLTPPSRMNNYVMPSILGATDIQSVGQEVWILAYTSAGDGRLLRLVNDSRLVASPTTAGMRTIAPAIGEGAWLLDTNLNTVTLTDASGGFRATYPMPRTPNAAVIGPDGNLWVRTDGSVVRMLTGQVPTIRTAPGLGPTAGVTTGTQVTSTYGAWNYLPSAFAFQWQRCASSSPATCTDIAGATGQSYVVTGADPYLRAGVSAYNPNGLSAPAYSAVLAVGSSGSGAGAGSGSGSGTGTGSGAGTPTPPGAGGGPEVAVGGGIQASLDGPSPIRRGGTGTYDVSFTSPTATGRVTFTFQSRGRTRTVADVPVTNGEAATRWRVLRSWPRGTTVIRAAFTPAAGSPLTPGSMVIRVRVT